MAAPILFAMMMINVLLLKKEKGMIEIRHGRMRKCLVIDVEYNSGVSLE